MFVPEELDRRLTDHCSSIVFAPTRMVVANLEREALGESACLTGDTNADALRGLMSIVTSEEAIMKRYQLGSQDYILVTLNHPSNVDIPTRLRDIQAGLDEVSKN